MTTIERASVQPTLKIGSSTIMSWSGGGVEPRTRAVVSGLKTRSAFGREARPFTGASIESQEFVVSQLEGFAAALK